MSTIDEEAPGPLPSETPATTTRRGRGKSRSSNIHGDLIMFAPTSVASSAVNQHMFHARHEPKQQQQSPELMGPILRRKKVVSMPIGAGGDFFSTIVETEPLVGGPHRQLAERGGDRTKSNSLGHEQGHTHRVRQETPTRRKKQSSFVNGLVRRKQISLDLLGPNDFFAIPQEEEVTEELLVPTKEEEEVVAAVAAGEEGELQEQQEEAKKPVKLFAPLRFQPRMVPKSRGGGHGSGGHGGHPAPASNHDLATIDEETKSAVRSYSMANQELRLQVMSLKKHIEEEAGESQELVHASQSAIEACNKSKEQEQAIKSKLLLGEVAETAIAEEQSVKDEDGDVCEEDMEEDDGNIIRATKRDKIRTGILFLLMLGITLVVALWKTHPEIELYLFVPVGLACVTYCPGNLETRDFFDNGHNHFITGDVIDIIMNIDANEEANGTGFLVQIYGEETHTVKATLEFPGPAPDERISEEQRLVVDFPDPEEHHIIIVNSTNPDLELSFTLLAQVKTPLAQYSVIIAAVIMIVVYLFILLEVIHRALVAIFGSMIALMFFFIMEGGYVETIPQIMLQLEWSTLGLLFGMMIIVGELSHTGVFEWCAVRLLVASNGSFSRLLVLLCTLTAVASAFLDNVTTMLLVAPVTIDMCNILEVDPRPYLISEVLLSNIGGTATLIGDPPNIIIGSSFEEIGFVDFIINVLPIIFLVCIPVSLLLCIWIYRYYLTSSKMRVLDTSALKKTYPIYDEPRLMIAGTVTFFVIIMFFLHPVHHKDTAWVALIGGFVTIAFTNPHDVQDALRNHVEWDVLLFFAGLFVLVEVCAAMGLLKTIGDALAGYIASQPEDSQLAIAITLILWVSAVTSAFLDNIPYTATMIPVIQILSDELPSLSLPTMAWALSLGACLGGNGTLLGASANIVTAGLATNKGYEISFLNFLYPGMLTMIVTVAIANVYMLIRYVWAVA